MERARAKEEKEAREHALEREEKKRESERRESNLKSECALARGSQVPRAYLSLFLFLPSSWFPRCLCIPPAQRRLGWRPYCGPSVVVLHSPLDCFFAVVVAPQPLHATASLRIKSPFTSLFLPLVVCACGPTSHKSGYALRLSVINSERFEMPELARRGCGKRLRN